MTDARAAVEAVWRIEAPRLIGGFVRVTRDLDRAEDLAQDALVIALMEWQASRLKARTSAEGDPVLLAARAPHGTRVALCGEGFRSIPLGVGRS